MCLTSVGNPPHLCGGGCQPALLQNPAQLQITIQQFMVQLGVGGCVEHVGNKFVLIPGNRIYEITCEPPSIIEASLGDMNSILTP